MTEIQPFVFPTTGQPVRTLLVDGEPWTVAADVCSVLGIANPSQAVSSLDDDEKMQVSPTLISSEGKGATPWLISESGLYSLILRSRKPEAKVFKRWITHEMLPSIRKTGSYSMPSAPVKIELVIDALAELAYREHVVPFAGRTLAFQRWRKPRKGLDAFVQLTIDLKLPGIDGTKALSEGGAR